MAAAADSAGRRSGRPRLGRGDLAGSQRPGAARCRGQGLSGTAKSGLATQAMNPLPVTSRAVGRLAGPVWAAAVVADCRGGLPGRWGGAQARRRGRHSASPKRSPGREVVRGMPAPLPRERPGLRHSGSRIRTTPGGLSIGPPSEATTSSGCGQGGRAPPLRPTARQRGLDQSARLPGHRHPTRQSSSNLSDPACWVRAGRCRLYPSVATPGNSRFSAARTRSQRTKPLCRPLTLRSALAMPTARRSPCPHSAFRNPPAPVLA